MKAVGSSLPMHGMAPLCLKQRISVVHASMPKGIEKVGSDEDE